MMSAYDIVDMISARRDELRGWLLAAMYDDQQEAEVWRQEIAVLGLLLTKIATGNSSTVDR